MSSTVIESSEKSSAATSDQRAGKYLVFHLGKEEFGIRVLKVREIMGIQDITAVPQTPGYVKGVINLRGRRGGAATSSASCSMAPTATVLNCASSESGKSFTRSYSRRAMAVDMA